MFQLTLYEVFGVQKFLGAQVLAKGTENAKPLQQIAEIDFQKYRAHAIGFFASEKGRKSSVFGATVV